MNEPKRIPAIVVVLFILAIATFFLRDVLV